MTTSIHRSRKSRRTPDGIVLAGDGLEAARTVAMVATYQAADLTVDHHDDPASSTGTELDDLRRARDLLHALIRSDRLDGGSIPLTGGELRTLTYAARDLLSEADWLASEAEADDRLRPAAAFHERLRPAAEVVLALVSDRGSR